MIKHGYDVIIIGGGPAGLAAAEELAKNKKSVLLLEKNKEIGPKVCAGGLTTKINQTGIPLDITDHKYSSVITHTNLRSYTISLPEIFIATVSRKKLGEYQQQKASKAGVKIITGTRVDSIEKNIITANGQKYYYKFLIGADGSNSMTRRYLGVPTKKIILTFQYIVPRVLPRIEVFLGIKKIGSGYAWIFPHKNYTSIGISRDKDEAKGLNLRDQCTEICRENNINLSGAKQESWIINYDYQGWQFDNIYLVGDAAGFASSLTGEGIYCAVVSGQEAAKKIINPNYQAKQIHFLLRKKEWHEKFLRLLQLTGNMSSIVYNILGTLALINKKLKRKAINFFFD